MPASLSFSKIVATPTETAWSQVYHAGNLFALVSLSAEKSETDLNSIGKEMFNTLESSFFSLEKKTLTTISDVIEESIRDIPSSITLNACIAFSKEAILYLFLVGEGDIIMKRGEKVGVILTKKEYDGNKQPLSSSGFLSHGDVLLMETGPFARLFQFENIQTALELHLPNDITEKLTSEVPVLPGDASAVTLLYQGATSPDAPTLAQEMRREVQEAEPEAKNTEKEASEEEIVPPSKTHEDEIEEKKEVPPAASEEKAERIEKLPHDLPDETIAQQTPGEKEMRAWQAEHPEEVVHDESRKPQAAWEEDASPVVVTSRSSKFSLPSRKVLIGIAALLLLGALIFIIFFTKQSNETSETKAVYESTYAEATKKYDEAEALKTLNASLAQDDYKKAAELIKAALPKVKKGSDEEKKLTGLLQKIEQNITATEGATVETKAVDLSESPLLELAVDETSAFVAADEDKQYALTSKAVIQGSKDIITNDEDWTSVAGLGVYNGNVYILDKKEGILKFAAGSDGYGKSSYFTGDTPSLTNASSMGIDGSIYVLFNSGVVKKYTKGVEESFVLSGVPSPLASPKQLVTGTDIDDLYILDSGNSRIVQLSKDGAFKKAWKADVLKDASMIDVQEADKKIYILQGKNLFMLTME